MAQIEGNPLAQDSQVGDLVQRDAARAQGPLSRAEDAAQSLPALAREKQVSAPVRYESYWSLKQLVGGD